MGNLKVGTGKVNITPPVGTYLAGYAGRKGPCIGIHDELYSKAIVLKKEGETFAIITNDLTGLDKEMGEEIRNLIYKTTKISPSNVIITASHTHSGPLTYLYRSGMGKIDIEYLNTLKKKIAGTVYIANKNLKKAYIGVGKGKVKIGVNRRGKILNGALDLKPDFEGEVDEEVGVLKIIDERKKVIAHLINYACHPVVLGKENLFVSADYPGVTQRIVEEIFGGITLFTNGSCGDINPLIRGGFEEMERLGMRLAGEAIKVSSFIDNFYQPQIKIKEKEIFLPWESPFSKKELEDIIEKEKINLKNYGKKKIFLVEKSVSEAKLKWAKEILEKDRINEKGVNVRIQIMKLGDTLFITIPAEVFVEIGKKIKNFSPFNFTYILGYSDGIVGYIPTKKALKEGGYEPNAYIWYDGLKFSSNVEDILLKEVKETLRDEI